jgi:hypothetical protein
MYFDHRGFTIWVKQTSEFTANIKRPGAYVYEALDNRDIPRASISEGKDVCVARAKSFIDARYP